MSDTERLGAKFDKEIAEKFRNFCDARGENLSSVLRRLVLTALAEHSYLDEKQKKAVGVNPEGVQ